MVLAKSRPIAVIFITDGSHFARECLMAFTPWHLIDAASGSHPPHPLCTAGSTGRRNTCVKSLCWGFKLQGLAWPFVELLRSTFARHCGPTGKNLSTR